MQHICLHDVKVTAIKPKLGIQNKRHRPRESFEIAVLDFTAGPIFALSARDMSMLTDRPPACFFSDGNSKE
jgi:hypothetical protein